MKKYLLIPILLLPGCAGLNLKNAFQASLIGAALGGIGGYALSPNKESRALNAGVFGVLLGGAGYLAAKAFGGNEISPDRAETLELRENNFRPTQELTLPATNQKLPDFLEKRLTPLVLEQWTEKDSVSADGSLNEPHRVWRIKRHPELVPKDQPVKRE